MLNTWNLFKTLKGVFIVVLLIGNKPNVKNLFQIKAFSLVLGVALLSIGVGINPKLVQILFEAVLLVMATNQIKTPVDLVYAGVITIDHLDHPRKSKSGNDDSHHQADAASKLCSVNFTTSHIDLRDWLSPCVE